MNKLNKVADLLEEWSSEKIFCRKENFTYEKPLSVDVSAVCINKQMVLKQVQIIDNVVTYFSGKPDNQLAAEILAGLPELKKITLSFLD